MGIPGLLKKLKSITTTVHLRNYEGLRLGVDVHCWLHRGSYYCDLIWMPLLGNILEFTVALFLVKKISQFQNFSIRRYGIVSTCYFVASENLFGILRWSS